MGRHALLHTGVVALLTLISLAYVSGTLYAQIAHEKSPGTTQSVLPAPGSAKESPDAVTDQTYDVEDILTSTIRELAIAKPPNGFKDPATTSQLRQQLVQDLLTTIQFTIAPDSWSTTQGTGTIREEDGQLIVHQTSANQGRVAQLLRQIRQKRQARVSLNCRVLLLDEATFKLLDTLGVAKDGATVAAVLDDDQINKLLDASAKAPANSVISSPRLTLNNGDSGTISISQGCTYTSGYKPTVPQEVSGEYLPERTTLQMGFFISADVAISSDRQSVIVKALPRLTRLDALETIPALGIPADKKLLVQQPKVTEFGIAPGPAGYKGEVSRITLPSGNGIGVTLNGSIMLSIPTGKTLLVGGEKVTGDIPFPNADTLPAPSNRKTTRYVLFTLQPKILEPAN